MFCRTLSSVLSVLFYTYLIMVLSQNNVDFLLTFNTLFVILSCAAVLFVGAIFYVMFIVSIVFLFSLFDFHFGFQVV